MSLRIFPATDLHLLNGTTVSLRFFAHLIDGDVWTDLSMAGGFAMAFNPMPPFVTQAGLSITATGAGSMVTRVAISDPIRSVNVRAPIRLSVHRELRRLFLPRAALELQTDRQDRVLTVYGQFQATDGSLVTADITAHPYLRYRVNVTAGAPAVTVTPAGRISTGNAPGAVEIQVSVDSALNQPAPAVTMIVTVVAAITDRPILTRFHTGAAISKKSILFLPDGFTPAQQGAFETLARTVGRRLLQAISPYRHLRESFDLYTAFVPSAEEGATIGPPIIGRPGAANVGFSLPMDQPIQQGAADLTHLLFHLGHPATSPANTIAAARARLGAGLGINVTARELPQSLYDLWQSLRTWPLRSRVRETFFGLLISDRHHGTAAIIEAVPTPAMPPLDAAIFLARGNVRDVVFDERRLPDLTITDPKTAHLPALSRFVGTLRVPGEADRVGAVWAAPSRNMPAGDSFGLVVIIARADHYAGMLQDGCLLLGMGAGILHHTQASVIPGLLDVTPVPRPINAAHTALRFEERPLDSLMDAVAHELAHSAPLGGLNDEYGGRGRPPQPAVAADATFVENAPNTQLLANAFVGAGPGLNPMQIKWNWERVEGAARVVSIRDAGGEIEIGINAEDAVRWPALVAGRLLTMRGSNLAAPAPGSRVVGASPANIAPQFLNFVSFNPGAQTMRCAVRGPAIPAQVVASFPPGSVILVPLLIAGAIVRLITGELGAQLVPTGVFSPSGPGCAEVEPVPPTVTGFGWPGSQLEAVAAYEGGAKFNCGVIRPTGVCKMRTVVEGKELPTEFCFACKYAMVYTVDPAMLTALEWEYP